MDTFMLKLFNMSITAAWLILAVIALRFLLKKAPKYIHLSMWALAGIRLICPFSIESVLSIIPSAEPIPQNVQSVQPVRTVIPAVNDIVNPVIQTLTEKPYTQGFDPVENFLSVAVYIWIAGFVSLILYSIISYLRLRRKVKISVRYKDNIFLCDNIKTPFILGIFRPKIYLPSGINANHINHVISHESAHIKRADNIIKPLGFLILCIHWFNPLVWAAYNLFCRDIELACDEKVIGKMETDEKKNYSETLLALSMPVKILGACPLAFGETGVKDRIKSVLNYKKPALWIIIISVIAVIAVAAGFMTSPQEFEIDGYHYIDKYYYDKVIGAERANDEMRDISYRIGEDMVITKFFGTGTGNSATLGTLKKYTDNKYEIGLVLDTLPALYSEKTIKTVYCAEYYLSDKYIFIMFKNGDFIGAYLPTDSSGNYYVMESFRLKRNSDVTVEYATEVSEIFISGYTTHDDVTFGIIETQFGPSPHVVVKCENNTGDKLCYGTAYGVFRHENGKKIDCNTDEDRVWTTPLCVSGEKIITRKFTLTGYDISVPGLYSVEFSFGVGENCDTDEYRAIAEFYIEETVSSSEVKTSDPSVIPETSTVRIDTDETTTSLPSETTVITEPTTTAIYDYEDNGTVTFNAEVIEVNKNSILVEPFEGENERNSASRISVSTVLKGNDPLPEIKKGDYVTIKYDGMIQETFPAQITVVYSITLHQRGL